MSDGRIQDGEFGLHFKHLLAQFLQPSLKPATQRFCVLLHCKAGADDSIELPPKLLGVVLSEWPHEIQHSQSAQKPSFYRVKKLLRGQVEQYNFFNRPFQSGADSGKCFKRVDHEGNMQGTAVSILDCVSSHALQARSPSNFEQNHVKTSHPRFKSITSKLKLLRDALHVRLFGVSVGTQANSPRACGRYYSGDCSYPICRITGLLRDAYPIGGTKRNPSEGAPKQRAEKGHQRRVTLADVVLERIHATPCGALVIGGILA